MMLLRGLQTAHELMARAERMARFPSIDDLRGELDMLIGRRPPLVQLIERAPGQREERYAQLLTGAVAVPAALSTTQAPASDMEMRVAALEEQVVALTEQVRRLSER